MKLNNLETLKSECESAIRNAKSPWLSTEELMHAPEHSPRASLAVLRLLKLVESILRLIKLVESIDRHITSQGYLEADHCVKYKVIFTSNDRMNIRSELDAIATEFVMEEGK